MPRSYADLHEYQPRAITRFYENEIVQAVMCMGSGKTVCAMTAIKELIDDSEIRQALVLAPKRVCNLVWLTEPAEWDHLIGLRLNLLSGTPHARAEKFEAVESDIVVCGIDNTVWLCDLLAKLPDDHPIFDLLVIDELSRFKNPTGKRAKALFKLVGRFKNRWGLTGTPAPNGLLDQFTPLKLLTDGEIWGKSFYAWRARNFWQTDWNGYNWSIHSERADILNADVAAVSFTVDPSEVPSVHAEALKIWVDLPAEARTAYDKMERHLFAPIESGDTVLAANQAVASGKLEQIAQGFIYEDGEVVETLHREKIDALHELIEGLGGGERLLVGYQFKADLAVLRSEWPDIPYLGAGVSDAKADAAVAAWNAGDVPIMAVHPASAGHGLNMQAGGHHLALFALPWSAEYYDQLIRRLARQGQQNAAGVFVHHIMARNTVDEIKFSRVHDKMSMQDAFVAYLEKI